jgi:hypothetical protein
VRRPFLVAPPAVTGPSFLRDRSLRHSSALGHNAAHGLHGQRGSGPTIETEGLASFSRQGLAALNETITGQAAVVAIIDQFKILMVVMLIASPLVLFLRKPAR